MIRFGIIGCGEISKWHINAIQSIPQAVLTAVCDRNPDKARWAGREYNAADFCDEEALMVSGLVDAVCICTPSGLHADSCMRALGHGLHTAVEKPLAITPASLQAVLAAEKDSGKKLMGISQVRYGRDIERVKALLDEGRLGRITMADLSMKYYRDPAYYADSPWRGTLAMDGGGALLNQGIHGLDLLCWLCGGLASVYCLSKTCLHTIETEDTLSAAFTLNSGGLGVLSATTSCYPGQERRLEICGTEGSLTLIEDALVFVKTKDGEEVRSAAGAQSGAADPFAIGFELHKRQLQAFVTSIEQDTPSPLNGAEAAAALNTAFALYESAKTGNPVAVTRQGS